MSPHNVRDWIAVTAATVATILHLPWRTIRRRVVKRRRRK